MADDANQNQNLPPEDQIETAGVQITERDIVFDCPHCGGELIVDSDGVGMKVACALCGGGLVSRNYPGPWFQSWQAAPAKLKREIKPAGGPWQKSFSLKG